MRVFIIAHSEYRGVYVGIAQKLREEMNSQLDLYVSTPQEEAFYRRTYPKLFDTVTVARALYVACTDPVDDPATVVEQARKFEALFSTTINELAVSDRHLGRGFAPGGFRHPRSRISENTSYVQMLNGFNTVIAFWRNEILEKRPSLVVNPGKVLSVIARAEGIPQRLLTGSRYKNYYFWADSEYLSNPNLEAAYRDANATEDIGITAPYDAHMKFREKHRKDISIFLTLKKTALLFARYMYWRLRGYQKAKGYYVWENATYLWRRRGEIARMTNSDLPSLADFSEAPYAFFPLATEPETALQRLSPEYLYQLSAIISVARDLPAGATLAVKEHFAATGRRPRDFLAQIRELKNVRLMNMSELGMAATRDCKVVVTISGSSGLEGAVMGKPVISFGRHNVYNFLDHVMVVTDEAQVKGYLERAFTNQIDVARAEADGMRFLQALIDTSFDLGAFIPSEPDSIAQEPLDRAFRALVDGLDLAGAYREAVHVC